MNPVARFLSRSMAILVGASILFMAGCARASLEEKVDLIRSYPCDDADHLPPETAALLADTNTVHNEVHDCQRLVVVSREGQLEFGPLVGIFPILSGPVSTGDDWNVIATVFNWKEENYRPLGIRPGWSCLVMKGDSAEIRPASDRCAEASFAGFDPVTLTVVRTDHDDVPMTARWGWDDTTSTHYIGMPCPGSDAWCEIGALDVQPQEWIEGTVPGWYDQQHLAVKVGSDLRPGPWATIFPAPGLRDADERSFERNGGAEVAFVLLEDSEDSPSSAAYFERFGFRPTPAVTVPGSGNEIRLELGSDDAWSAHVFPPRSSRAAKRLPVTFVGGLQHGAKGSVRWRWSADDESWWISCPDGCCSPDENEDAF